MIVNVRDDHTLELIATGGQDKVILHRMSEDIHIQTYDNSSPNASYLIIVPGIPLPEIAEGDVLQSIDTAFWLRYIQSGELGKHDMIETLPMFKEMNKKASLTYISATLLQSYFDDLIETVQGMMEV